MAGVSAEAGSNPLPPGAPIARRVLGRAWQALLLLALLATTLVYAEAFIWVVAPAPMMPRYVTGSPWGVRTNIANSSYHHWTPDTSYDIHINSQGMRADEDYALNKPAGTCRIALFGDSFFMGFELPLRQTIAVQLQQGLEASGHRVQVLNFAVSGFGTAEMLQTYERRARAFNPDIVIFSWHESDPADNVRSDLLRYDNGSLIRAHEQYLPGVATSDRLMRFRVYRWINEHSQLYSLLRESSSDLIKELLSSGKLLYNSLSHSRTAASDDRDPAGLYAARLSGALLLEADRVVVADDREFLVAEIPAFISRTSFEYPLTVLSPDVTHKLPVMSPRSMFDSAAQNGQRLFYEAGLGHFSPTGAKIFTAALLQKLQGSPKLAVCQEKK